MRTLVCDLEADGLRYEATRIWCIAAVDVDTEEVYQFGPDQIEQGLKLLQQADKIVFHNGIMYDFRVIKKLYPWWTYKSTDDTFILSALFNPDRKDGHSIDAWGQRFGRPKPKHDDWSRFTPDMLHRCTEDAQIGLLTYRYLQQKRKEWDWELAIRLEYKIAEIQAQQEENGVYFNKRAAIDLWIKIVKELQAINKELLSRLPQRTVQVGSEVKKPFKKDGSYAVATVTWWADTPGSLATVKGPYSKVAFESFNLNSHDQIKGYLLTQGWKPTEWNYQKEKGSKKFLYNEKGEKIKTTPKLTEDSFVTIQGDMGVLLARRAVLTHRKGLIYNYSTQKKKPLGWLTNIRSDHRIPAEAVPQACNSGRYQHKIICNVPGGKAVYGREIRDLFIVPEGKMMVGCDAAQLEVRTEAHNCYEFPGGVQYAHELIDGDQHAKNAIVFGTDRQGAKAPKYALTFGCSEGKLAETIGCDLEKAKKLFDNFWVANTALKGFKDSVIKEFNTNKKQYGYGFIKGLDGRQLRGRSKHSLVNLRIQSDGVLIVKTAMCFLYNWVRKFNLDAKQIIQMHDEIEAEVAIKDVKKFSELCLKAFETAGKFFNYKVPMQGDVKIGKSWGDVH